MSNTFYVRYILYTENMETDYFCIDTHGQF